VRQNIDLLLPIITVCFIFNVILVFDILTKLRNKPLLDALNALGSDTVSMSAVIAVLKNHGVGTDSMEEKEAMEVHMALKAYVKVAGKRIVDTIPMLIHQTLIKPFLSTIAKKLQDV
jgi:hypothetical protein